MEPRTQTTSTKQTGQLKSTTTRFCFRVRVEDVPGPPLGRSLTLANDFLRRNFCRSFSWESDYVYTPVNIGGQGKVWVLLDVDKNVEPKPDLKDVELVTFRVRAIKDSLEYERVHYAGIRSYTSIFPWGGRSMQPVQDWRTLSGREGETQHRQPVVMEDVGIEGSSA
ncbi:hypothetical protein B0H67DRAFT_178118 [Lasiosphaeris hirsuta]|uniref:Uncharacterized protein n=1 Tax=Lasiosphaeris hirsuta TaxID=260670 RepID=A0AA40AQI7_9PEZI|nr:hypothetical protein B0H67DRAFT_178118 [Lasiosphaeris hirsuta]